MKYTYQIIARYHDAGASSLILKRVGKPSAERTAELLRQCGYTEIFINAVPCEAWA